MDLLRRGGRLLTALLVLATAAPAARAQLSPGPLATPHANLEGMKNCTQCHALGKGVEADKCLACHTLLAERITAGKGLHAGADHANCVSCHSEHHGADYALVHWEGGEANFDHAAAGFTLEGAHAALKCRQCHREDKIANPARLTAAHKDLDRSFLGLGTACLDCHADPHRGTLGDACLKCHGQSAWRPAAGFDHAGTQFPLRGKHADVTCDKCHPRSGAAETGDLRIAFKGVAFADCKDCHKDPHAGRFTATCASCHQETDWKAIRGKQFDHDLTRYPLRGKHAAVDCKGCHQPGAPHRPLAHDLCLDCHQDKHLGQFTVTGKVQDCARCHSVAGYSPSSFTVAQHAESSYPLAGAHLAVPCRDCHLPTEAQPAGRFRYGSTSCTQCHADPHGKSLALEGADRRCERCHTPESWRRVNYDHAATGFALADRHAEAACTACHVAIPGAKPGQLRFSDLRKDCASCHEDIHRGQFLREGEAIVDCARCHDSRDWMAARFDHTKDARFVLDGAHAPLACTACHLPIDIPAPGEAVTLRYRPLPTDCKSCHPTLVTAPQGDTP
ncbi:MAG: cytochrome c3 family protein [Candidatus Krumholzibacteriia bacterium]|nr:hypothetical protein [Candidatus Latescibacterota bacterium]